MKEALTSFDIRVLSKEISSLRGARLNQIYQQDFSFILKFNLPKAGKQELYVEPGRWLFLGKEFEKPPEPPPFAQSLRRVLGNALLKEVAQVDFDRILTLRFTKEKQYSLVVEMFGKGNVVLLEGDEILQVLHPASWRARELKRGERYRFPPAGVDTTSLDAEGFTENLRGYDGPVVRILASQMGLGGLYAEETCLRSGVRKDAPIRDLTDEEIGHLFDALRGLVDQTGDPSPVIILDPEPKDVVPFPLQVYSGKDVEAFSSMSEALQDFVKSLRRTEEAGGEALERARRKVERQEEVIRGLQEDANQSGAAADYLYVHYQEVQGLLSAAREGELKEGVDQTRGVLRLRAGEQDVELDYRQDVDANARRLYERKKEAVAAMVKVEEALAQGKREVAMIAEASTKGEVRRPSFKPSRKFWFDTYRWSLTSGGLLLLAGRDARGNEKLVKKHLEPGDRYVHADLPGAPSVVLKQGAGASDRDLKEACLFAIAFSKAWRVGLGSGSAYWVTPEQVSKTAQSGEYLRTGSFVVRGRRNYHHNLALAIGVGRVSYQGEHRVIPADPEAIARLSDHYVILEPAGPTKRGELAHQLSQTFEVPIEEVERVLPAGTFLVREVRGLKLEQGSGNLQIEGSRR